jgi:hypothetical protein
MGGVGREGPEKAFAEGGSFPLWSARLKGALTEAGMALDWKWRDERGERRPVVGGDLLRGERRGGAGECHGGMR